MVKQGLHNDLRIESKLWLYLLKPEFPTIPRVLALLDEPHF